MINKLIDRNPGILGWTSVFAGTRVPVRMLTANLEAGDQLTIFSMTQRIAYFLSWVCGHDPTEGIAVPRRPVTPTRVHRHPIQNGG